MKARADAPATELSLLVTTEERLARALAAARADADRVRAEAHAEAERARGQLDAEVATARAAAAAAIEAETAARLAAVESTARVRIARYEALVGHVLERHGAELAARLVARVLRDSGEPP